MPKFIAIISHFSYGDKHLAKLKKSLGNKIGFYDLTEIQREVAIKILQTDITPKNYQTQLKQKFDQAAKSIISNLSKSKFDYWIILLPYSIPLPPSTIKFYLPSPTTYLSSISSFNLQNRKKLSHTIRKTISLPKWKATAALWLIGKLIPANPSQLSSFEKNQMSKTSGYKPISLNSLTVEIKKIISNKI